MRLQSAILMLATLAIVANSSRHQPQQPVAHSLSLSPSINGESPSLPPSSAPAPSIDCITVVADMFDCLSYLGQASNDTKVSSSCCSGFESVVDISPNCVCEGLNVAVENGYVLNMSRVMDLPRACKVTIPSSAQNCKVSPTPAPGAGPAGPTGSESPEIPPEEPPTSPSTRPPTGGSAPSNTPGGSLASAPSPSKGGAYSVSISFLGLISLLVVTFSVVLV
ncbi:lipid binding protein, putative [Ricinus communis]|uniref:Lipid binding protein, putative n=1 Tax=Ricinus communis TaxID=3988 RepID=B9RJG3_RICCO|nr:lipid binding protein, putative [Ricinus communis]|eukprot:XP_002513882.1 non-specific lipid-transfer protein-like protein At2g13820 isoform X1 [Ricinus communis]